jgi:hypothetical protein
MNYSLLPAYPEHDEGGSSQTERLREKDMATRAEAWAIVVAVVVDLFTLGTVFWLWGLGQGVSGRAG